MTRTIHTAAGEKWDLFFYEYYPDYPLEREPILSVLDVTTGVAIGEMVRIDGIYYEVTDICTEYVSDVRTSTDVIIRNKVELEHERYVKERRAIWSRRIR